MAERTSHRTFRPAEGLRWAPEADGVRVFGGDPPRVWSLPYPEAAVWTLAASGHRGADLVRLVAATERVPAAEAAERIERAAARWARIGLLVGEEPR